MASVVLAPSHRSKDLFTGLSTAYSVDSFKNEALRRIFKPKERGVGYK
jgi:hypothetical protein